MLCKVLIWESDAMKVLVLSLQQELLSVRGSGTRLGLGDYLHFSKGYSRFCVLSFCLLCKLHIFVTYYQDCRNLFFSVLNLLVGSSIKSFSRKPELSWRRQTPMVMTWTPSFSSYTKRLSTPSNGKRRKDEPWVLKRWSRHQQQGRGFS